MLSRCATNVPSNVPTNVPTYASTKVPTNVPTKVCLKGKNNSYALNPFHWKNLNADTYDVRINGKLYGRITGGGGGGGGGGGDEETEDVPSDNYGGIYYNPGTKTLTVNDCSDMVYGSYLIPIYVLICGMCEKKTGVQITFNGKPIDIVDVEHVVFAPTSIPEGITDMYFLFANLLVVKDITFGGSFNTRRVESMYGMFANDWALESIDMSMLFDGYTGRNIGRMFDSCYSLSEINIDSDFVSNRNNAVGMLCYAANNDSEHNVIIHGPSVVLNNFCEFIGSGLFNASSMGISNNVNLNDDGLVVQCLQEPPISSLNIVTLAYVQSDNYRGKAFWNSLDGILRFYDVPIYSADDRSAIPIEELTDTSMLKSRDGIDDLGPGELMFNGHGIMITDIRRIEYYDTSYFPICEIITSARNLYKNVENATSITPFVAYAATEMQSMYSGCKSLTGLDGIEIINADADCSSMFFGCSNIQDLRIYSNDTLTNAMHMFFGCIRLSSIRFNDCALFCPEEHTDMFQGVNAWNNNEFTITCDINANTLYNALNLGEYGLARIGLTGNVLACKSLGGLELGNESYNYHGVFWNSDTGTLTFRYVPNQTNIAIPIIDMVEGYNGIEQITFDNGTTTLTVDEVQHIRYMADTNYTHDLTNMDYMFADMTALESVDLRGFDTSNVTSMTTLFADCISLTTIYFDDSFDTSNVKDMSYMFYNCSSLQDLDITTFNTYNVLYGTIAEGDFNIEYYGMASMFYGCTNLGNIRVGQNFALKEGLYTFMGVNEDSTTDANTFTINAPEVIMGTLVTEASDNYSQYSLTRAPTNNDVIDDPNTAGRKILTLTSAYIQIFADTDYDGYYENAYENVYWQPKSKTLGFAYGVVVRNQKAIPLRSIIYGDIYNDVPRITFNGETITAFDVKHVVYDDEEEERTIVDRAAMLSYHELFANMPSLDDIVFGTSFSTANVSNMSNMFFNTAIKRELDIRSFNFRAGVNCDNMFAFTTELKSVFMPSIDGPIGDNMFYAAGLSEITLRFNQYPTGGSLYTNMAGDNYASYGLSSKASEPVQEGGTWVYSISTAHGTEADSADYKGIYYDGNLENGTLIFTRVPVNANNSVIRVLNIIRNQYFGGSRIVESNVKNIIYTPQEYSTTNIQSFESMFSGLASEHINLCAIDTTNATSMNSMFANDNSLESLDIRHFITSNTTNFSSMFLNCFALQMLDLSSFDITGIDATINMSKMFTECTSLLMIIIGKKFNIPTTSSNNNSMFYSVNSNPSITDNPSNQFIIFGPTSKINELQQQFALNYSDYDLSQAPTSTNIVPAPTNDSWSILVLTSAGGLSDIGIEADQDEYKGIYWNSDTNTLTFMIIPNSNNIAIRITYLVNGSNGVEQMTFDNESISINDIQVINYVLDSNYTNVSSMAYLFQDCTSLKSVNISGFSASDGVNMRYMFKNCTSLKSVDLSGFSSSSAVNMEYMFYGCSALKSVDLSGITIDGSVNMSCMFVNCSALKSVDLSGFSASGYGVNMGYMFNGCSTLKSVTFPTTESSIIVSSMQDMFNNCTSLTEVDLSGFTSGNVNMEYMFNGCTSLTTITLWSSFTVPGSSNRSNIFKTGTTFNLYNISPEAASSIQQSARFVGLASITPKPSSDTPEYYECTSS